MRRELRAQSPLQEARESGEGPSQDRSASRRRRGDDLGLRFPEHGGHVLHGRGDGSNASPLEFGRDLEEHALTFDLLLDEGGDEPQFLDALDLDPGPSLDRDVQVLSDRPDAAQDLPRRPQQVPERRGTLAAFPGGFMSGVGPDSNCRVAAGSRPYRAWPPGSPG